LFIRFVERGFVYALLLIVMGTPAAIFYADIDQDALNTLQGSVHTPIVAMQLVVVALGFLLILTRWRRVAAAALKAWPVLLLTAVVILSVTWSIDPMLSLRRAVMQTAALAIGIYLGERYTLAELALIVAKVYCLTMCLTFVAFAVSPHLVVQVATNGAWKGLTQNKNTFGLNMAFTAVLLILVRLEKRDWIRYAFLVLAILATLLSRSMTSVATGVLIVMLLPFMQVFRLPVRLRIAGSIAAVSFLGTIIALIALNVDSVLALMGKDSTFTGRTQVWKQLLVAIRHHPYLGYGYSSFWTGLRGESLDVLATSGWLVPEAHNGYLETWLGLGIPGVLVTSMVVFLAFRRGIEFIRLEPGMVPFLPVVYYIFVLFHNSGESDLICSGLTPTTCLFTAFYTAVILRTRRRSSRVVLDARPRRFEESNALTAS